MAILPTRREHHTTSEGHVLLNKAAWVLAIVSLIASLLVLLVQLGFVAYVLERLESPGVPPQIIRISTPPNVKLKCLLESGSTNEAPVYRCMSE